MDRRTLLAVTGAYSLAALVGCIGDGAPESDDNGGSMPNDDIDDHLPDPSGTPTINPDVTEGALRGLATDNLGFGMDVFHEAVEGGDNLFFSPYSISVALAMTYAGAGGETATEMEDVLRFANTDTIHEHFGALQHALAERETTEDPLDDEADSVDAFKLRVANALWGRQGEPFADDFLQLVEDYYGAGLAEMDFVGDPDGERKRINAWVADQTEDRIEDLLPQGSVDANTVLVLTNAIYFLASWESEFDPDETEDGTFHTLDGSESTVSFMHQHLRTNYATIEGAEAVELRYVGGEVSMVLILPQEGEFDSFESTLTAATVFDIFDDLSDHTGDLVLPQFEIASEIQLSELLINLGMETPFGPEADFSGMFETGGSGVAIDEVYHDAFVTIDEEGTEADAGTAVTMVDSAPPDWGTLRFNRPFLFCIRDRPSDAVLFLGRVADPNG